MEEGSLHSPVESRGQGCYATTVSRHSSCANDSARAPDGASGCGIVCQARCCGCRSANWRCRAAAACLPHNGRGMRCRRYQRREIDVSDGHARREQSREPRTRHVSRLKRSMRDARAACRRTRPLSANELSYHEQQACRARSVTMSRLGVPAERTRLRWRVFEVPAQRRNSAK